MQLAILILALAASAQAKQILVPALHPNGDLLDIQAVTEAMTAAGYQGRVVHCDGKGCVVEVPDASAATAATLAPFFSNAKTRGQKKAEAEARDTAILDKLKAGTANQSEIAEIVEKALKRK